MSFGVVQAEKMTTESGYSLGAGNASSFKNRIINGGMVVDQRGSASAAVTSASGGTFSVDRFASFASGGGVYTTQQSTDVPTGQGLIKSIVNTVTTIDATPTTNDYYVIQQNIEGLNVSDLGWGGASARSITISFWVKSSITGTYTVALRNSALNRAYRATYTINSANTWEQKSVTVVGDTSGTWLTDTNTGIRFGFALGAGPSLTNTGNTWTADEAFAATGQTQWIATLGATFYVTGVQFELGTVATSFDFRSIGTEEYLCKRYYQKYVGGNTYGYVGFTFGVGSGTSFNTTMAFEQEMRVAPSLSSTLTGFGCWDGASLRAITAIGTLYTTTKGVRADMTVGAGGLTTGASYSCYGSSSTVFQLSAEL